MARVLFVEPEEYSELEISLQEQGIEYDRATRDEAKELFSRIDYDGIVGPEIGALYDDAEEEGIPYMAFDSFGTNYTDILSGRPDVDAERIDHYLNSCPDEDANLFLQLLRHDAGNDLNVAMGYIELLEEDDYNESNDRYWEVIGDKMRSIEDLLDTSRVVNNLKNGETYPTDLNNSVDSAVEDYEAVASDNDIEIDVDADENYLVNAGPLLDDMYAQLIENAINHSGGETIDINISGNERVAKVEVADDGKGIPEKLRDEIIQKGVTNGDTGNSGIGLFLFSRIADIYDITVDIGESEELGGAKFTTVIPRTDIE
ncbi:sensor histidine kinase [Candidatus Nanohalovita haloferacivicina]|uniref:sensor histidine kinase n=1 Tax=Candidatus Nanohalovita haloferacivicina TaxID=2978046 RepID=UPI00325FDC2A|nr:Signal transduction histidine kinase, contains PAS domain [Candidatus Nanohalobia archaeon BNXNv]